MTIQEGTRYNIERKGRTIIITDTYSPGVVIKRKVAVSKNIGNFAPIWVRLKGKLVSVDSLLYKTTKVY